MLAITAAEFNRLASYIKDNYGIHLKAEKEVLVRGRLSRILKENNFRNFSDYYDYVVADQTGEAATILIDRITTNHTFFMRETKHFYFFRDHVLPYLKTTVKDRDLRIWSAGCSSGEEPYTLAMIIDEYFGNEKRLWNTELLASDISTTALDVARAGIYSKKAVASLPPHWRANYFKKYGEDDVILIDKIKNDVIFAKFNLMEKVFPFQKRFQVIFCRNVMIYFDLQTRNRLVRKFYDLLEYGGYLFVGHSESLDRRATHLKYVMPAVYRKE